MFFSLFDVRQFVRPVPGLRIFLLFLLLPCYGLILGPTPVVAQSNSPVIVSIGTHALTTPWYLGPISTGLNPAVFLGTDHTVNSGKNWRFFSTINLGFFRHRWWMTGASLEPEVGISRTFADGFHTDLKVGLGYMHYFWRRKSLELKDGEYVEAGSWGRPSINLPLSLTLGYRGHPEDPLTVAPFVTGRWGIQGLFLDEVPVMTHFFLLGGVRIHEGKELQAGGE